MTAAASAAAADPSAPVLERLARLHPRVIDLSLDRILRLLDRLDRPQAQLPPVVHVAGTNGKGSTVAFLRAMLEAAGYRVHTYTSPHLIHFRERIRLAGRLIDDATLIDVLATCERVNGDDAITYFEVTTAAAFLAFARVPADVLLLETGLGGRLDATNVVERPAVTAITPIALDHQAFLGETLVEIAAEKAGILKSGVPTVLAPQPEPTVAAALRREAERRGAPVVSWSLRVEPMPAAAEPGRGAGFRFRSAELDLSLPAPALPGAHQIVNAGTAIACLAPLGLTVPDAAIRAGLAGVDWPARLQRLTQGPLAALMPGGCSLWLDGGHNPSAGLALAAQAAAWADEVPPQPLALVFGMLASKAPDRFLAPLAPWVRCLHAVTIPDEPNSLSAEAAAAAALGAGVADVRAAGSVETALLELAQRVPAPHRILICGSLYLAGQVLAANGCQLA